MGATTFGVVVKAKTAEAAFRIAVEGAQYQRGHGGYTGTIAEKGSFITITPDAKAIAQAKRKVRENLKAELARLTAEGPAVEGSQTARRIADAKRLLAGRSEVHGLALYAIADGLIQAADPRVDDKWGPAGCIEIASNTFYFFGWASE
jgi:hypothetical protein